MSFSKINNKAIISDEIKQILLESSNIFKQCCSIESIFIIQVHLLI